MCLQFHFWQLWVKNYLFKSLWTKKKKRCSEFKKKKLLSGRRASKGPTRGKNKINMVWVCMCRGHCGENMAQILFLLGRKLQNLTSVFLPLVWKRAYFPTPPSYPLSKEIWMKYKSLRYTGRKFWHRNYSPRLLYLSQFDGKILLQCHLEENYCKGYVTTAKKPLCQWILELHFLHIS